MTLKPKVSDMYIPSNQYREIELRARQLRAEMLREFFAGIAAKFRQLPQPAFGKAA